MESFRVFAGLDREAEQAFAEDCKMEHSDLGAGLPL
jgi:hypothetical protein